MTTTPATPTTTTTRKTPTMTATPTTPTTRMTITPAELMTRLAAAVIAYNHNVTDDNRRQYERDARATFAQVSQRHGGGAHPYLFTGQDHFAKGGHNDADRYWQWIMYLPPARSSGLVNLCKWATRQCMDLCLVTAGRMDMGTAPGIARYCRAYMMVNHTFDFLVLMAAETATHSRRAVDKGVTGVGRNNGTSDVEWQLVPGLADLLYDAMDRGGLTPRVTGRLQDYTKRPAANIDAARAVDPLWNLTPSATERTTVRDYLEGMAIVVNVPVGSPLPTRWHGAPVIDGDIDGDIRLNDHKVKGARVLLRAKGQAKKARAGHNMFVKDINDGITVTP
jgi:hypothetical protein